MDTHKADGDCSSLPWNKVVQSPTNIAINHLRGTAVSIRLVQGIAVNTANAHPSRDSECGDYENPSKKLTRNDAQVRSQDEDGH